jgi:hypothetical protein
MFNKPTYGFNLRHELTFSGCRDAQHNVTQYNDTQHNDTQHNDTQHYGFSCDAQDT